MAVHKYEFSEWRQMDITADLLNSIAETATATATKILNSDNNDGYRDQYLKGVLAGLSSVAGWTPEFIQEDDQAPQDALNEA